MHDHTRLIAASKNMGTPEDELVTLLRAAKKAMESGNGGDYSKLLKKNRWLQILALIIGAAASAGAAWAVMSNTVESNKAEIEKHDAKPMQDQAMQKFNVLAEKLVGVQKGQAAIVVGLKELTKDKLDALERERDKLERELARERRRNR